MGIDYTRLIADYLLAHGRHTLTYDGEQPKGVDRTWLNNEFEMTIPLDGKSLRARFTTPYPYGPNPQGSLMLATYNQAANATVLYTLSMTKLWEGENILSFYCHGKLADNDPRNPHTSIDSLLMEAADGFMGGSAYRESPAVPNIYFFPKAA